MERILPFVLTDAMRKIEPNQGPLHQGALRLKGEQPAVNVVESRAATAAGNEILCEVLTAIRRGPDDDNAVRMLSRLVFTHEWVLQLAELHEYLNWLVRKRRDHVVNRIINDPQHPGRRHESKVFLVHLMRAVIAAEDCSARVAAREVANRHGRDLGGLTADAIESDYSRYQHEYDRLRTGQFVGMRFLANRNWKR